MTVNCLCGTTYSVNVPTVPINCRIKNISMGGFGFIALNRVWVQLGDILNVTFALIENRLKLLKKVIFRTIKDNYTDANLLKSQCATTGRLAFIW